MIPPFETTGFLPPGVHVATWAEFTARFGTNPHRTRLLGGLDRACAALRVAHCRSLHIDGSFVTAKDYPADYDGCWDHAGVDHRLLDPVLLDFTNQRAAQKAKYLGELFIAAAVARTAPTRRLFLEFFQHDRDTDASKGIVLLNL